MFKKWSIKVQKLYDCKFFASRLLGQNRFFNDCGAMLDVDVSENIAETSERFIVEFKRLLEMLPIKYSGLVVKNYSSGFIVVIQYPYDLLNAMCDIMDRMWEEYAKYVDNQTPIDFERLLQKSNRFLNKEQNPVIREVYLLAREKKVNFFIYKDNLYIGSGIKRFCIPVKDLHSTVNIPWDTVGDIPILIVTGTNGKTTTARLTEFICRNSGKKTGSCDSDFVMINGQITEEGDLSGPQGNQLVLMNPEVEVAVLEVARGGLVKRGLLPNYAVAATVTNIANDHIGQSGIENQTDLALLKGVVYAGVKQSGTVIINLDDANIAGLPHSANEVKRAYISAKLSENQVSAFLTEDNFVVFIENDNIVLKTKTARNVLNNLKHVPLTVEGLAKYNYENILHALSLCYALGLTLDQIQDGLAKFGSDDKSNFGRWNYFKSDTHGHMVVDTAHNSAGLSLVLKLAHDFRKLHKLQGRLGLMYGITGDRRAMAPELSKIVIDNHVDHLVIKEILTAMRGSEVGEMPQLFKAELLHQGYPENKIEIISSELENAKFILGQSKPDDVYILCVHEQVHEVIDLLKQSI